MSSTTHSQTPSPAPEVGECAPTDIPANDHREGLTNNVDLPLPPMTAMVPMPSSEWVTKAVERATAEGTAVLPAGLEEPEQIGAYRIVSRLGAGGMGVVYRAEQEHPVRRTVALKVLKAGMDTREVVARFEAERQALAMMSHPGVARVYDAGVTNTGRPYFAMEYVPGVPLTKYCEDTRLPLRKRLDLFIQVCRAVQHAHQKGIIHRDLKPSNILVTQLDGEAAPKVIDFGIAKATQTGPALTDRSLHTHAGMLIGTPEYMSPEQAFSDGADVDTRSDIYSLGVVLYQLLTGALPYDSRTLRHLTPESVARLILDSEPLRPSVKLGRESVDTHSLRRQVHGDLDWITLKAIDKDRSRRYESAFALAADVMRYLESEPVTARPPTLGYRTRKFVRRHRLAVSVGGIVTAALVVGLGLSVYGLVQARIDRDRAQASQALAEEVMQFVERMLSGPNPSKSGERDMTLRKLLDDTARRLNENTLATKPEVEAAVRLLIGKTYTSLQVWDEADKQLNEALADYESVHGASHPKVADVLHALGALYEDREDDARARSYLTRARAMREQHLGAGHVDVAATLVVLANLEALKHQHEEADRLYQQAEGIYSKALGPTNRHSLAIRHNRALVMNGRGDKAGAIAELKALLELKRGVAPDTSYANTAHWLAGLLKEAGELEEAAVRAREALTIRRKMLEAPREETAEAMHQLAWILYDQPGKRDEALDVLVEQDTIYRANGQVPVRMQLGVVQRIFKHHEDDGNEEGMSQWRGRLEQLTAEADGRAFADAQAEMEKAPNDAARVAGYGTKLARMGQFSEALAQFEKAKELKPDDHWYWMQWATLLAYLEQGEKYDSGRREMLARFGGVKDRRVADRIAKAALLRSMEVASSGEVEGLVTTARAGGIEPELQDWIHLLVGLAEYRKGNYAAAGASLEIASQGKIHPSAQISAQLLLAMSIKGSGRGDGVAEFLAAKQRVADLPKAGAGDLGDGVENWMICQILYREAAGAFPGK